MFDKKRFYLYDRWFYLLQETEDKLKYTSVIKETSNGIKIEIDKNTKMVDILYFQSNKLLAKLSVTDITDKNIHFHYEDKEPQEIMINDNIYVNLLVELFADANIKNNKSNSKEVIKITRKKKLNKMCYREPDFPLDKEIDINNIKIKSDILAYYLGVIESLNRYIPKLEVCLENTNEEKIVSINHPIKNLVIPDSIYLYDRNYKFVNREENIIHYINKEDGITNLEIKLDPNDYYLSSVSFIMSEEKKNSKNVLEILPNDIGGITVKFNNEKKKKLRISYQDYENATFNYTMIYDKDDKKVSNLVEILSDNEKLSLTYHPIFTNVYVDCEGNEYRISNQDFARLSGIASFGPGIFKGIEKKLTKEN